MKYQISAIAAIISDTRAGDRVFAIEAQPGQRSQVVDLLASLLPGSERIMLDENTATRAWLSDTPTVVDYRVEPGSSSHTRDLMMAVYEGRVPNTAIVFERTSQEGLDGIPIPLVMLNRMVWLEAEGV